MMTTTMENLPSPTKQEPNLPADKPKPTTLAGAVTENFDQIINLASQITEIRKLKTMGNIQIKQLQENRKYLLAEAEAYAQKKNADTNDVVQKMNLVRLMMNDFYAQSNGSLSSEDFRIVITEIVNQMGKV